MEKAHYAIVSECKHKEAGRYRAKRSNGASIFAIKTPIPLKFAIYTPNQSPSKSAGKPLEILMKASDSSVRASKMTLGKCTKCLCGYGARGASGACYRSRHGTFLEIEFELWNSGRRSGPKRLISYHSLN